MSFSSKASAILKASPQKVWNALTQPELVKQYFFGTNLVTDWKVGAPIYFRGEWQGHKYEDKGIVLSFDPPRSLSYSYWSSMSGSPDKPENYQTLVYDLKEVPGGTELTITQFDVATQEKADHSSENWKGVVEGLRKVVEG